jgi:hypothetical protein
MKKADDARLVVAVRVRLLGVAAGLGGHLDLVEDGAADQDADGKCPRKMDEPF